MRESKNLANECGAAAVEFALILPILVLLLFGIIEFGRAYNAKVTITHAAREAARSLAIGDGDPIAVAKEAAPQLDPSELEVVASACVPGEEGIVTVTYPFTYSIPLFGDGTITLESKGVMRCGG